ncbi:hypothetical protein, partial [Salmonella enterica]|uniref:hypothetical protein n=1 Tax=Salmonella enterica TaxID=28901 RepID=UPI003297172B
EPPPPTTDEVWAAHEQARDVLEHAGIAEAERVERVAVARATDTARRLSRRYGVWGSLFAASVAVVVAIVAAQAAYSARASA